MMLLKDFLHSNELWLGNPAVAVAGHGRQLGRLSRAYTNVLNKAVALISPVEHPHSPCTVWCDEVKGCGMDLPIRMLLKSFLLSFPLYFLGEGVGADLELFTHILRGSAITDNYVKASWSSHRMTDTRHLQRKITHWIKFLPKCIYYGIKQNKTKTTTTPTPTTTSKQTTNKHPNKQTNKHPNKQTKITLLIYLSSNLKTN